MSNGDRPHGVIDPAGKWLGIVVFVLGVALLVTVFGFAYRELVASGDRTASQLVAEPAVLLFKTGLLFVMGFVASAIANKGVALYQAARLATAGERV